jgi:ribonucleotide monophosphatase NagD (HAD superfamily)
MVGDDIVSDVGAAIDAGLVGVRVRTGKFRSTDLEGRFGPISSSIRSWICTTAERWRQPDSLHR